MRAQHLIAAAMAALLATSAQASVQISSDATKNMNCTAGVCSPTAKDAVLNIDDLTAMLSSGDVKVTTGHRADTIGILSPFAWASTHRLTLDAVQNVNIKAPVTVQGTAGLTIITNDGGSGGDLMIYPGGKIAFWDTGSSLIINGSTYTLVSDIKTLIRDIGANQRGSFALANDINLHHKKHGVSRIRKFFGSLEGLGNSISNLDIEGSGLYSHCYGMFGIAEEGSVIRDINLKKANVALTVPDYAGALVGCNSGVIANASSDGSLSGGTTVGGLAGLNTGSIFRSHSAVSVRGGLAGGLVGESYGTIDQSYATGSVTGTSAGGLVGRNSSDISNSYAVGAIAVDRSAGGGFAAYTQSTRASYSTGAVSGEAGTFVGGFVGDAGADIGTTYWDQDLSGQQQGCGEGDCTGVTGLSDAQLKSGLPAGFDPKAWRHDPSINNGYPYLINNPPPK